MICYGETKVLHLKQMHNRSLTNGLSPHCRSQLECFPSFPLIRTSESKHIQKALKCNKGSNLTARIQHGFPYDGAALNDRLGKTIATEEKVMLNTLI